MRISSTSLALPVSSSWTTGDQYAPRYCYSYSWLLQAVGDSLIVNVPHPRPSSTYRSLKAAAQTAKMQGHSLRRVIGGLLIKSSIFAAAAVLPDDGDHRSTQLGLNDSSSLDNTIPFLNGSALLPGSSILSANEYDIVCNPRMGSNFDLDDCLNSLREFEVGRTRVTFSERPPREGAIPLPFRWMGRE